jgi:hypothetical protein
MRFTILILLLVCFSCKNENEKKIINVLGNSDKDLIKTFANNLYISINNYEYELIRSSWDNELFRKRVNKLTKTEQTVFDYYFDKEFATVILNENIDLVNKLKFNTGKLFFSKITYYPTHAEIIYSLRFAKNVDFWKYRVELINNIPKLTDYYSFRDEIWQSQNIINIIRLNSRYTATTKERQQANRSLMESDKYLLHGDSLFALQLLYEIPETHLIGNALSLKRINLAFKLNDTIFASVLIREKEFNKSTYISYLYGYYFYDTIELDKVFYKLEQELGTKNMILDSLKTLNYFWR